MPFPALASAFYPIKAFLGRPWNAFNSLVTQKNRSALKSSMNQVRQSLKRLQDGSRPLRLLYIGEAYTAFVGSLFRRPDADEKMEGHTALEGRQHQGVD